MENLLQDMAEVKQDVAVLKEDVAVLKEDMAEVKQDVAVLKEDVAVLKDDVAEVKQDVAVLKEDVAVLKEDMAEVKQDVAVLKEDMTEVKGQQSRMSGQLANLAGNNYENRAIEPSRRLIRRSLNMTQATVIHASRWHSQTFERDVLLPAIADGRISRTQADELEEADSVLQCQDQDGNIMHAVVEISMTVQDTDRRRASERAEILAAITGTAAVPFVVGQEAEERDPEIPDVPFLVYAG